MHFLPLGPRTSVASFHDKTPGMAFCESLDLRLPLFGLLVNQALLNSYHHTVSTYFTP